MFAATHAPECDVPELLELIDDWAVEVVSERKDEKISDEHAGDPRHEGEDDVPWLKRKTKSRMSEEDQIHIRM